MDRMFMLCFILFFAISAGAEENWPSFRGTSASGATATDAALLESWDAESGEGIRYQVAIPGMAHSSPIIWGNKLFLTTAVSSDPDADFVPGLYGSGQASADQSVQEWRLLCLDKRTGKVLWSQTSTKGVPKDKRHIKSTYANSTPATDGMCVVALFGSEGLFAYDMEGEQLWQKDLGRMDVGAYDLPSYEWGPASSPILHDGLVYVQVDTQGKSFVIALDAATGETRWQTDRDELPSWGSPTVYLAEGARPELITNASNWIRAYDPANGNELWRLGGSSKITAPTPVFAEGLIIVASGRAPERPIFAIRPGGQGDISGTEHVAWSLTRQGPYMPTPLIYQSKVYVGNNDGVFACYDLKTGEEHYRGRLPHRGNGFSASPVAAAGKIYFPSEDGITFVIEAGEALRLLAENPVGEPVMASPAISDGVLYLRGQRHLYAIGPKP